MTETQSPPVERWGDYIRRLREKLDMTQEEFARAVGLSNCVVISWEQKRDRKPRKLYRRTVREYAKKLGIE